MRIDIVDIQPGWAVEDAAGEHVGQVISIGAHHVHLKTGGFRSHDYYVPASAIASIEEHRVELSAAKGDLGRMGWDHPPAEPVSSGARRDGSD